MCVSRSLIAPGLGAFFTAVAAYLDTERPADVDTVRLFVALKGPRRGQPLSARARTRPRRGTASRRTGTRDLPRAATPA